MNTVAKVASQNVASAHRAELLRKLNCHELKGMLRGLDMHVSGNKDDLIRRLLDTEAGGTEKQARFVLDLLRRGRTSERPSGTDLANVAGVSHWLAALGY